MTGERGLVRWMHPRLELQEFTKRVYTSAMAGRPAMLDNTDNRAPPQEDRASRQSQQFVASIIVLRLSWRLGVQVNNRKTGMTV